MSCRTETKEISGREYSVRQWSATRSMLMKMKLLESIGPALAVFADSNSAGSIDYSKAISNIFSGSSPEKTVDLIKECILLNVACDDKKITDSKFEELFGGDDLLNVYKVFAFVLQVNYGGFFKGQLAEGLLAKVKEQL